MSYTPRAGSYAARIHEWFVAQPEGTEATANEIAAAIDCAAKNVFIYTKPMRREGMLQLEGRRYSLSVASDNAPQEDQSEYEFMAAIDTDGQLFLRGIEPSGDGFVLTLQQTVLLREYLLHTGSWIEQTAVSQRQADDAEVAP